MRSSMKMPKARSGCGTEVRPASSVPRRRNYSLPGEAGDAAELGWAQIHLSVLDREPGGDHRLAIGAGLGEQCQRQPREPRIAGAQMATLDECGEDLVIAFDRSGKAADQLQLAVKRDRAGAAGAEPGQFELQIVELDRAACVAPGGCGLCELAAGKGALDGDAKRQLVDRVTQHGAPPRELHLVQIDGDTDTRLGRQADPSVG